MSVESAQEQVGALYRAASRLREVGLRDEAVRLEMLADGMVLALNEFDAPAKPPEGR